ncbi:hypothetical protein [Streptomyces bambusae]|nr:hypothetical protein [Streptomyces bambusae]
MPEHTEPTTVSADEDLDVEVEDLEASAAFACAASKLTNMCIP